MQIPNQVQSLIDRELAQLQADPTATVLPVTRLALYDAFGPTFASSSPSDRVDRIRRGTSTLTAADRVRARLAVLTAHHVLPLWLDSLDEAGLLAPEMVDDETRSLIQEFVHQHVAPEGQTALLALIRQHPLDYQGLHHAVLTVDAAHMDTIPRSMLVEAVTLNGAVRTYGTPHQIPIPLNPQLAPYRSIFFVPLVAVPSYILQLAEGVLDGSIAAQIALDHLGDIQEGLGTMLGYAEEDFSAQAYDICLAVAEALSQTLGLGPFDGLEITATRTDEDLIGKGAAAAAAVKAFSGIFEDQLSTRDYDAERRRSFWIWWLTEAIPAAWNAEQSVEDSALPTMPFRATVQVTVYDTDLRFRV